MRNRDLKFFNVAKEISKLSDFQPEHIGAIIVLRNEVISTGYNRSKSSPSQGIWSARAGRPEAIYTHAEISCLDKLSFRDDFRLAKIYVYRETKNGTLANARPCEICTMALKAYGVNHIFYTTNDGYAEEVWE